MRFRDGTIRQQALFAALVGSYLLGLLIAVDDKLERVGQPDAGWMLDGYHAYPMRWDAVLDGLGGGERVLQINGNELEGKSLRTRRQYQRMGLDEVNVLRVQRPGGAIAEVSIRVRPLTWKDVFFAEGSSVALGTLFVAVGVGSFLLRPYAAGSWALLALCCSIGGVLIGQLLGVGAENWGRALYFRLMVGFVCSAPFHTGLAFPVIHPMLLRRPRIVLLVYGAGAAVAGMQFLGWYTDWAGPLRHFGGGLDTSLLLIAGLFFIGRCSVLALRAPDPLIAQRGRIVLVGVLFGVVPLVVLNFIRGALDLPVIDVRLASWSLTALLGALGYLTVRHDLLNARIAVRRAVLYGVVVGVLTLLAILLVAVRPYAVAALLLPLLYWWPRFNGRLNAWLYPKRVRFPDIIRAIGNEMSASATVEAVLAVLAQAPERLCDARSVAFLLPGVVGPDEHVSAVGVSVPRDERRLADEALVRLMITTRREILRDHIAVEPQYAKIQQECYACFDRLRADLLLPVVRDTQVIGGLAIGPRVTGDVYEAPELDALSTVVQQAVQAIIRVEATERLRRREMEFADLKRFFPPQIIDQVMAKGGAAELRSQRKLVTVFFADLRGFTSFSDSVEPEEVMATLAEYHTAMGRRIAEFAGTLERFAGDGFMVFFNDPVDQPDHVERAVRMALAMRADMPRLRDAWLRKGYRIDVGMGIHSGYATCGFVGYEGRRDYAVIGNVTNLAARLSGAAAGGEILVTARVRGELHDGYVTEPAGELDLKGFHQPQPAFRVLDTGHPRRVMA
jgi:class 3 adenylate cyclase